MIFWCVLVVCMCVFYVLNMSLTHSLLTPSLTHSLLLLYRTYVVHCACLKAATSETIQSLAMANPTWITSRNQGGYSCLQLRADLVSAYVCRLLTHMDTSGAATVTPHLRADEPRSSLSRRDAPADGARPAAL